MNPVTEPLLKISARWTLILLLLAVMVWVGRLDLLPPLEKDELIHHLAIPSLWLRAGGFIETPWATFSYYPMNLDLLYLLPLALDLDVAAHFLHHAFGLAAAALIFGHLRRRLGLNWALLGALILLSTPLVMRLAASANVDLGLAFFFTAAWLGLIRWHEENRNIHLVLSGLALGLALGTKYQGLIGLPPLALAVFLLRPGTGGRFLPGLARAAVYIFLALAVWSPWLIKNYFLTGNPTYPLLNSWWGLPGLIPTGLEIDMFTQRRFYYGEGFVDYILIPLRFFLQGRDFTPQFFDGVLNPFLLVWPVLALIKPRFRETRPLALLALYWVMVIFLTGPINRYLAPSLPILALLSVYGLERLWTLDLRKPFQPALRAGLVLTLAGQLAFNAAWARDFWKYLDPGPFLSGRETRDQYLTRTLDHYPAMKFINAHLPPKARILFLYAGERGYYCQRDYFYRTWHSGEAIRPILEKAASARAVVQGLKQLGATHLLTRDPLLFDYLKETAGGRYLKTWIEGRKLMVPLFREQGYTVYALE
ncbi:MAG: glycosyltransferase family 39 protein [Thermodesulfobacteriota bacterium]